MIRIYLLNLATVSGTSKLVVDSSWIWQIVNSLVCALYFKSVNGFVLCFQYALNNKTDSSLYRCQIYTIGSKI
jgi:hypothetical protein